MRRRIVNRVNDIARPDVQDDRILGTPSFMAAKNHPVAQFSTEIAALIAAVEDAMQPVPSHRDREFNFQRDAFRERCQQAKMLADRLGATSHSEWSLRSGDAHRIRKSLQLSLDYFRRHPPA